MKYSEIKMLIKWYRLRFNRTVIKSMYFDEWVDRYKTGNIERYMDSKSKAIWLSHKAIKEIYSYDEDFDKIEGIKRITP